MAKKKGPKRIVPDKDGRPIIIEVPRHDRTDIRPVINWPPQQKPQQVPPPPPPPPKKVD